MSAQTGLVICSPLNSGGTNIEGGLDPQELRFALLYWDKFAWPTSNILHVGGGAEEDFLTDAGLLVRPRIELDLMQALGSYGINRSAVIAHIQAFLALDRQEPGTWALAQGDRSLTLDQNFGGRDRSILLELFRAIPVPDKDVPLPDILEFREKRKAELTRLRSEIDHFYDEILSSNDSEYMLKRRVSHVQLACKDAIRVCQEAQNPFRLSDWKVSISSSPAIGGLLGGLLGSSFGLTELGATVGAAAGASIKLSRDRALGGIRNRNSPYWYVGSFHAELF